jgi:hypothetical protein
MNEACGSIFMPEVLEIDVNQGEVAEGILQALQRFGVGGVCTVNFVEDEPWMSLVVDWTDGPLWAEITVIVDASTLPIGTYETSVRSESECVECATVVVRVRDPSGIADDPPVSQTTWGAVKSSFR